MAFTSSNGRTQTALADINITPLVDVVLVLLIIFMVTAPILQSGIEVNVPKTRTVKEITEERTVITINKDQRVFLGNDAININQIAAKLRQKIRDPRNQFIFIRADENVPFGAFATVMDDVKQSDITNVSIVTQPLKPMAHNAEIISEHDSWDAHSPGRLASMLWSPLSSCCTPLSSQDPAAKAGGSEAAATPWE